LDFDPSAAFDIVEETIDISSLQSIMKSDNSSDFIEEKISISNDDNLAAFYEYIESNDISGFEPVLGGELREKAIWVDEAACIGCQYCVHVATNTFIVDEDLGRARVIRQNGDDLEVVQEAMDTCPVDCMHWVDFEDLEKLEASLNRDMFQSLGKLPRVNKH
tara:strand:- start:338 stop:823 length:486 start_codon:yes stop_codon:yes gene_type:complete